MESYREFLAAELARRIGANPRYSQRAFAKQLGLSAGELSEILRGRRSLSSKSAVKIARALGLTHAEAKRLLYLAQVEKTPELSPPSLEIPPAHQLSLDLFALVSDWYCFAVLSLAECEKFQWSERWIARRLGISPLQARIALRRLERVGLIERVKGRLRVAKDSVFSPDGVPSEAIRNYHRQILALASRALDAQPVTEREVGGVTFAADPRHLPAMKREVAGFLDELAVKYGSSRNKKEVFQLEVALFKLTQGDSDVRT